MLKKIATFFVLFLFLSQSVVAEVIAAGYAGNLTSPGLNNGSDTFVYSISGQKPTAKQEIGSLAFSGCWTASQVASVLTSKGTAKIVKNGPSKNSITVEGLNDSSLPLTVTIKFTSAFGAASTGTNLLIKTSKNATISQNTIAGPNCKAPAPIAQLNPTSLTFPDQLVGSESAKKPIQLSNIGNAPLQISAIVTSGDFLQTNNCGTSIAGGQNCIISVSFKPTQAGTRAGTLTITNNATGSPHTATLAGNGISNTPPPAVIDCPTPSATVPDSVVKDAYVGFFDVEGSDTAATAQALANQYGFQITDIFDGIGGFAAIISADKLPYVCGDNRLAELGEDVVGNLSAQTSSNGLRRIGGSTDKVSQTVSKPFDQTGGNYSANDGTGIGIAILDSGIISHEDLPTPVNNISFTPGGNGTDTVGHGTAVAGIIAALDNDLGYVGVAPKANIYSLQVANTMNVRWSHVVKALDWVRKHKSDIQVVNLSFAKDNPVDSSGKPLKITDTNGNCIPQYRDILHTAVCRTVKQGITVVAAASNNSSNVITSIPAAYKEVITVGAMADFDGKPGEVSSITSSGTADDEFWQLSNYGDKVDIFAPGAGIQTTLLKGSCGTIFCDSTGYSNTFTGLEGTSFAAPFVTGAAALYIATHQGSTPAQVKQALVQNQEPGPIKANPGPDTQGVLYIGTPLVYELENSGYSVSCFQNNAGSITVHDPIANQIVRTITVSPCPETLAASPDGKYVYVAIRDNASRNAEVRVIDAKTQAEVGKADLGDIWPHSITVSSDSKRVYVSSNSCLPKNVNDACVNVLEVTGAAITKIADAPSSFTFSKGIVASPIDDSIYVAGEPQCGFDPLTDTELPYVDPCHKDRIIKMDSAGTIMSNREGAECGWEMPRNLSIDPKGEKLYVANKNIPQDPCGTSAYPYQGNSVSVLSTTGGNGILSAGNNPEGTSVDPKGAALYVGYPGAIIEKNFITNNISALAALTGADNYAVAVTPNSKYVYGTFLDVAVKP